jgi:uncharacterized protein YyaL (SSP411 family)
MPRATGATQAHESFEDAADGAADERAVRQHQVDREERPDLDSIYQTALALMGEQGGWPLTMFLTPAGEPFWGGTYFPRKRVMAVPASATCCAASQTAYRTKPDSVKKNTEALVGALRSRAPAQRRHDHARPARPDRGAARSRVDPMHGWMAARRKFPQPAIFELIWRAYRRTKNAEMSAR